MPVSVHATPNPNAHKYVLAQWRIAAPLNASTAEAARGHPLAERLFAIAGVYNVLLAQDFVTVNKRPDVGWDEVEPIVLESIEAYLTEAQSTQDETKN